MRRGSVYPAGTETRGRAEMEQLYRVRVALRGVNANGDRILTVPDDATIRVVAYDSASTWATIQWNGVLVRVFRQDLETRTESITTA